MPDSGWTARNPVNSSMPARASRDDERRARLRGFFCGGRVAIVMSACPEVTGDTSTPRLAAEASRSPSTKSSGRRSALVPARPSSNSTRATYPAPVVIAAALPRLRGCRTTSAPAARAISAVVSLLPSSTTTTRSTPSMARTASTVAAMRAASSFAGMIAATAVAVMASVSRAAARHGCGAPLSAG